MLEFVYIGEGMPRVRESDLDRLVAEGVRVRRAAKAERKVSDVERLSGRAVAS